MNIVDTVGRTALIIADWRRQDCHSPAPLATDHLAGLFVQAAQDEMLREELASFSAGTQRLIHLRSHLFDQRLLESMERGVEQLVVLGCGLDTRALRLAPDRQRIFEVDRQDVLDFKHQTLTRAGYWNRAVSVGCDYTQVDLVERLEQAGLDPAKETFVLWEGNSMYLSEEQLAGVLQALAQGLRHVRVSFDYVSSRLVAARGGPAGGFADMAAPWLTGFESITPLAERLGLDVLEDGLIVDFVGALHSLDRGLFNDYFLCTLENRGE